MKKSSILLSAALAGVTLACSDSDQKIAEKNNEPVYGECHGINECKGQGECGTKTHTCAGLNECKGQGWIRMEKDPCEKEGGRWQDFTMKM